MHVWADIFVRELAMLATLAFLGSGPASYLGRRFSAAARLALAPVLGFCVGIAVFTTLIWFTAAHNTYWLLPLLAVASLAAATRRTLSAAERRGSLAERFQSVISRVRVRDVTALAVVCVVVAAPLDVTLHQRHSVGPTGFAVWDGVDYVAEPDGMAQESLREAIRPYPVVASSSIGTTRVAEPNFTLQFWHVYASGDQNLDAAPLSAALNEIMGLHGSDTQTPYLIVFLIMGALGAFGAVRYWSWSRAGWRRWQA